MSRKTLISQTLSSLTPKYILPVYASVWVTEATPFSTSRETSVVVPVNSGLIPLSLGNFRIDTYLNYCICCTTVQVRLINKYFNSTVWKYILDLLLRNTAFLSQQMAYLIQYYIYCCNVITYVNLYNKQSNLIRMSKIVVAIYQLSNYVDVVIYWLIL